MRVINKGRYLQYLPQGDGPNASMLLGVRQKKNDPWYTVENNVVNNIVLGMPWQTREAIDLKHSDGLEAYQIEDVKKMLSLDHVLNANPMGLGKTVEAVKMLQEVDARNGLLVTPKIIRHQWKSQICRWWGIPESRVKIFDGTKGVRVADDATFWLVNYDKLQSEATLNQFRNFQWEYLIADEAHRIKNRTSKRAQAIKSVPAAHRHALTGTPILRYVDDLWSILHFLDESYSGISYWNFVSYFCNVVETPWGNKIEGLVDDPRKVAILNTLLSRVCVRNDIEVAHGKSIETVTLPMNSKQSKVFRDLRKLALDELPEGMTIANGAVLTMRMRQLTSWPGLFIEGEVGPKFEWVLDICRDHPEEKFVVFSVFEKTVSALNSFLTDNDISSVTITGKNKSDANERNKQMFLQGRAQVLSGTIGAMGQGYDGLQEVARLMIIMDRDWSPEIMAQCEDRLKRMGQEHPVSIYYLECAKSFDQHVGVINQTKAADIRTALEGIE